eukprot:887808-Rhodomonas_salina.2
MEDNPDVHMVLKLSPLPPAVLSLLLSSLPSPPASRHVIARSSCCTSRSLLDTPGQRRVESSLRCTPSAASSIAALVQTIRVFRVLSIDFALSARS